MPRRPAANHFRACRSLYYHTIELCILVWYFSVHKCIIGPYYRFREAVIIMIDKISKLAKGILDTETPEIRILPEAVEAQLSTDRDASFVLEIVSSNGYSVKGLCYTEDPRIRPDQHSFVGRRAHLTFHVEAGRASAGEILRGRIILVTNAGEREVPYVLTITGGRAAEAEKELIYQPCQLRCSLPDETEWTENEQVLQTFLASHFPKDEELFEAVLKGLIRSKSTSPLAFAYYREAIRRNYQVTRLYESYVAAYPYGSEEMMPREVLLYFSYGGPPPSELCARLYKNVVLYVDRDSELYAMYEPQISRFAMENALNRRLDDDFRPLYDQMIYPGMIDRKAAELLPDILKCHRIQIEDPMAETVVVRYPELRSCVYAPVQHSTVSGATAFIPVYFDNAVFRFYTAAGEDGNGPRELPESTRFTDTPMFRKPELLRRCFEMAPEHEMLLLSAAREIVSRGIADEHEFDICLRALHQLPLQPEFFAAVIHRLSEAGKAGRWVDALRPEDYTRESAGEIWQALMSAGRLMDAWRLLNQYGSAVSADEHLLVGLADGLISKGDVPMEGEGTDPYFISLCKYLMDRGTATDVIIGFLAASYEGAAEEMYRVMDLALERGTRTYELPEKVLAFKLFTESRSHLDETFAAYLQHCKYQEMMVRAYLLVRCGDYFLYEKEVIGSILFEALESYVRAVDDMLRLPELMLLALTKHFSEMESLSDEQAELCQKLTDYLIDKNLIFCYTKKLRKKIRISQEIRERFYVEYHGQQDIAPRMMVRILPDESSFRTVEMKRVYRNIYVSSCILFMGDEMHYLIYDTPSDTDPAEEGVIKVTKFHKLKDDRFETLNHMMKALNEKDADMLKEYMLKYVETEECMKTLFSFE